MYIWVYIYVSFVGTKLINSIVPTKFILQHVISRIIIFLDFSKK